MNDPGVNVITQYDICFDKLIGPLPVVTNIMDTMVMIGLRCSEMRPTMQQLKVDPKECDTLGRNRYCHWLFYVQSARDEAEQNLEVVTKQGQLYYRAVRNIKAEEELLVWYSKDLANIFQVPDVEDFYDKDDRKHCCPYCTDVFSFPNPFKTHLMYRCEQRLAEVHSLNSMNRLQLESINRLQLDLYSAAILPSMKPNLKSFNFLDIYRRVNVPTGGVQTHGEKENSQLDLTITNNSTICNDYVQPISIDGQKRKSESGLHSETATKRLTNAASKSRHFQNGSICDGESRMASMVKSQISETLIKSNLQRTVTCSPDRPSMSQSQSSNARKESRRSPNLDIDSGGISAFKKVNKATRPIADRYESNSCEPLCSPSSKSIYPMSYPLPISTGSPPTANLSSGQSCFSGSLHSSSTSSMPNSWSVSPMVTSGTHHSGMVVGPSTEPSINQHPSPGQFPSPALPNGFPSSKIVEISSPYSSPVKLFDDIKSTATPHHHSSTMGVNDNGGGSSSTVTVSYRNPVYSDSMYRLSVSLPYSKQFGTPLDNLLSKQPQPSMAPIAASLLPPSLAVLAFPAQNWCAKCNASFRMTSDLVYHMRSHHKREVDPVKKRREEKLKCAICNESFRERHHLTRHMTSHQ